MLGGGGGGRERGVGVNKSQHVNFYMPTPCGRLKYKSLTTRLTYISLYLGVVSDQVIYKQREHRDMTMNI